MGQRISVTSMTVQDIIAALAAVSAKGGGILYFDTADYYLNETQVLNIHDFHCILYYLDTVRL